jgi:hypothetical protein
MWAHLDTATERNKIGARLSPIHRGSRSTLKSSTASGVFQQAGFAKLLRLVFDTAALRGSARMRPFDVKPHGKALRALRRSDCAREH